MTEPSPPRRRSNLKPEASPQTLGRPQLQGGDKDQGVAPVIRPEGPPPRRHSGLVLFSVCLGGLLFYLAVNGYGYAGYVNRQYTPQSSFGFGDVMIQSDPSLRTDSANGPSFARKGLNSGK